MALTMGCALVLSNTAFATVKDDIDRQYKRWGRAALVNDVDTILAILAPEYVLHTYSGKAITHREYEASLRQRKAANKPATVYETSMADITVSSDTALVTSDETSNNVSVDPITNKKVKLVHVHRYKDTWVRIRGVWRLRNTLTTVETTTVVPISAP